MRSATMIMAPPAVARRARPTVRPARGRIRLGALTVLGVTVVTATLLGSFALAQDPAPSPEAAAAVHRDGIWKAAVPSEPMHAEFDSLDPIGLAAGARIKADCSLNWVDPDDGARYCFSSGTSLEIFLEAPQRNIERARQALRRMHGGAQP